MSRILRCVLFAGAATLALLAAPSRPAQALDADDYWNGYWDRHWNGYRTRFHRPYVAPYGGYTTAPLYSTYPGSPWNGYNTAPVYRQPAPVYGHGVNVLY